MFQQIEPRNDEWNRKYNFTDESSVGFLIDLKNGLAFFGWKFSADLIKFYTCEQSVFEKRFKLTENQIKYHINPADKIHFLRFPIEM